MNGRGEHFSAAAGPSSGAGAGHRSSPNPSCNMPGSISPSAAPLHPLSLTIPALMGSPDKQPGPSSRPALERRTTETAASSGDPSAAALETTSSAPTSDGLRRRSAATDGNSSRSKGKEREFVPRTGDTTDAVEVLIHQVQPRFLRPASTEPAHHADR